MKAILSHNVEKFTVKNVSSKTVCMLLNQKFFLRSLQKKIEMLKKLPTVGNNTYSFLLFLTSSCPNSQYPLHTVTMWTKR
jgi:hypothetical protein